MTPRMATAPTGKGRGRNKGKTYTKQTTTTVPDAAPELEAGPSALHSRAKIAALAGGGLS